MEASIRSWLDDLSSSDPAVRKRSLEAFILMAEQADSALEGLVSELQTLELNPSEKTPALSCAAGQRLSSGLLRLRPTFFRSCGSMRATRSRKSGRGHPRPTSIGCPRRGSSRPNEPLLPPAARIPISSDSRAIAAGRGG